MGVGQAVEVIVEELKKLSKPVEGKSIAQVGTISANGDKSIGKMIAEAMKKVGNEGVITVEEAKSLETELDVVEGMQFDRGYLSPYFVTDPDRMQARLDDCLILINEKKISNMKDLLPVLEKSFPRSKRFLPSAMGLGLGWIVFFSNALAFTIGAFIAWGWAQWKPANQERYNIPIASGRRADEPREARKPTPTTPSSSSPRGVR